MNATVTTGTSDGEFEDFRFEGLSRSANSVRLLVRGHRSDFGFRALALFLFLPRLPSSSTPFSLSLSFSEGNSCSHHRSYQVQEKLFHIFLSASLLAGAFHVSPALATRDSDEGCHHCHARINQLAVHTLIPYLAVDDPLRLL